MFPSGEETVCFVCAKVTDVAVIAAKTANSLKKSSDGSKPKQNAVKHKVKKGETVAKIAKKYGVSVDSICKLNNMTFKQASRIRVGQVLRIK